MLHLKERLRYWLKRRTSQPQRKEETTLGEIRDERPVACDSSQSIRFIHTL